MVGYAYDIGQRKSSRIIEQAARLKAVIWAETLEQSQPRSFSGILSKADAETIDLRIGSSNQNTVVPLVGQYYQLIISLNDTRYLTVCDLKDMQKQDDDLVLTFSRPQTVQIMQRRHFHRYTPGQSFPVFVSWQEIEGESSDIKTPALGQVRDLSLQGMSIQVPENLDQHLFIGDTVYVRFSLNVRDPEYFTSATICHKDFNKDKLELVIGLQFLDTEENGEFQTRLRSVLNQTFVTKKGQ